MRATFVVASLFLALALGPIAVDAHPQGVIVPTLTGQSVVPAARPWGYGGRLVVDTPLTDPAVLLGQQEVRIYLDGIEVDSVLTDAQGQYLTRVSIPIGHHVLEARALPGPLEGHSGDFAVFAFPTWPAAPLIDSPAPGFYWHHANVTWYYPWTDGGYPVTSYTVERSHNNGPWTPFSSGPDTFKVDTNIVPGDRYVYRATSTTSYGTSNFTHKLYEPSSEIATVNIVGYRVCDASTCADIANGGSFTTTPGGNVTVIAKLDGVVDDHPVSAPGIANRTVLGHVRLPESARDYVTQSHANGLWHLNVTPLWAWAPAAGCEQKDVVAHARLEVTGRTEALGNFHVCV